jgi:hypothetical protein
MNIHYEDEGGQMCFLLFLCSMVHPCGSPMIPLSYWGYDERHIVMQQFQLKSVTPISTPGKIAALVFAIVFFLPILALAILAGIVAITVFSLLFCVGYVKFKIKSITNRSNSNDGRKNVRIRK